MNEYGKLLKKTREHLMTGVSYMIPVILAGAMLIAVSLTMSEALGMGGAFADFLMSVGGTGMTLFVCVLSAYVAYAIADRAGIAPGLIVGYMASQAGTGFMGGMVVGLMAGYVTYTVKKIKLPRNIQPIMALVVYPLVSTLVTAALFHYVIETPIVAAMAGLTNWLTNMSGSTPIVLGVILGAMIGFDWGGPVNKVAYTFAVGMLGEGILEPMGMVGPAISVAPIAMAVASFLAPQKYSEQERGAGKAALILGLVTISEGAIPFAVVDPLRVIISSVVGSAVAGAVAGALGVGNNAPLGGVLILPVVTKPLAYLIALAAGVAVTALLVNLLKPDIKAEAKEKK
jgi:fructose-specific PTS system IIC-like component